MVVSRALFFSYSSTFLFLFYHSFLPKKENRMDAHVPDAVSAAEVFLSWKTFIYIQVLSDDKPRKV